jgi:asparagine synthase (glutamine-hydrolysing)
MCGIAGILTVERPATPADVVAVRRMMDPQVHRGPDGEGIYHAPHVVLGHRRLSIIDLSEAGRQPMANEDGTVWVTAPPSSPELRPGTRGHLCDSTSGQTYSPGT